MNVTLANLKSAFVAESVPFVWTIGNEHIHLDVGLDDAGTWGIRSLTNAATGHTWQGHRAFALTWNGAHLHGADASVLKTNAEDDGKAVTLTVTLGLAPDLHVQAMFRLAPDNAVVQMWLVLQPQASGTVEMLEPLDLNFTHEGAATLRWVRGVQDQGGWRAEDGPYTSFKVEERPLYDITIQSGPRSTWSEIPWFCLSNDATNEGFFVGLQYAGRWSARFGGGDSIAASFAQIGITSELAADQRWTTPRTFIGVYQGDLDQASAVQYRFYRTMISPPLQHDFPWVQYNTWFSYACNFDAQTLRKEVDIAADLGVELFYIDAGWWAWNPRLGDNFSSGLGIWTENAEKFPDGLRAFADYVRASDMRFGMWVEPERVDVRTVTTATWKEEWLAVHDGAYVRAHWPADTETAWLCYGHPETQAWAIGWISEMIEAYEVAWLKWDSNYWGVCTSPEHMHGVGDGEQYQLAGVLAVMQELRRRFPNLIIENCAGGGTRMDFAMAEQTHTAWIDDATEPSHRVRFHLAGATYAYPPEVLNTWVSESTLEDLNHRSLPRPILQSIFRSRMLGAMGISCRMIDWPIKTRETMREAIQEYKLLRPLLRAGRIYHLLPQAELINPRLATPAAWEAYQVYDDATQRGAVLTFRGMATDSARAIVLKGLDAERTYTLQSSGGDIHRATGASLMRDGVACLLHPLCSELWMLEPVG